MLVLEPIFEADLPPEQYAYRATPSPTRAIQGWLGHRSITSTPVC
jgi:hypothetical protein